MLSENESIREINLLVLRFGASGCLFCRKIKYRLMKNRMEWEKAVNN